MMNSALQTSKRRRLGLLAAGFCAALVVGQASATTARADDDLNDLDRLLRQTKKDLSDDLLGDVKNTLNKRIKNIEKKVDKLRKMGDKYANNPTVKTLMKSVKKLRTELRKRVLGTGNSGAQPNSQPGNQRYAPTSRPDASQSSRPTNVSPQLDRRNTEEYVPKRLPKYNPKDYEGAYNVPKTLDRNERPTPSPLLGPQSFEPRTQRETPVRKPKGVLMRLGIDPKTYRRSRSSKSLLSRIRSGA